MQTLSPLLDCIDSRLSTTRRVFFAHAGAIDRSAGPLELTFESGTTVLLEGGGDGQSLIVRRQRWEDPFGDGADVDADTAIWIADHGKWTAVDVSGEQEMAPLIGKFLRSITELTTSSGQTCGVRLRFNGETVDVAVIADEVLVLTGEDHEGTLAAANVVIGRGPLKRDLHEPQ